VPANKLPIITESAPAANALVISPEYLMPPSAMIGTLYLAAALGAAADGGDLRHADAQTRSA
jgi:hypothetical protein